MTRNHRHRSNLVPAFAIILGVYPYSMFHMMDGSINDLVQSLNAGYENVLQASEAAQAAAQAAMQ